MTGLVWDELQRLKLALWRWAQEGETSEPPEYVRQAWEAVADAIVEAWPPEKRVPPETRVESVTLRLAVDAKPAIDALDAAKQAQQQARFNPLGGGLIPSPPDPDALT